MRPGYAAERKREQDKARIQYLSRQTQVPLLTIEDARTASSTSIGRRAADRLYLLSLVARVLEDVPLKEIILLIDWSPLFHTWEMKGTYPVIFKDKTIGAKAKELFEDATQLALVAIVAYRSLRVRGVYGFWPAARLATTSEVYNEELRKITIGVFHTLRQQTRKAEGEPNTALADFVAPKASGIADYIGAFAVTAGKACRNCAPNSRRTTTITTRLWRRHLPTGSPRHLRKTSTRKCAWNGVTAKPKT